MINVLILERFYTKQEYYIETETDCKYTPEEFKDMYTGENGERELKYLKSLEGDLLADEIKKLENCDDLISFLLENGIYEHVIE